jgi:hypothetical protein
MMKALIHASGDGYPAMKSLALLGLDTRKGESVLNKSQVRLIEESCVCSHTDLVRRWKRGSRLRSISWA